RGVVGSRREIDGHYAGGLRNVSDSRLNTAGRGAADDDRGDREGGRRVGAGGRHGAPHAKNVVDVINVANGIPGAVLILVIGKSADGDAEIEVCHQSPIGGVKNLSATITAGSQT